MTALLTLQLAWPFASVLCVQVGLVPDGAVTLHVIVPVGVIVPFPWTVTVTVKLDPVKGLDGEVVKLRVGVCVLTPIVADEDWDGL